LPQVLPLASCRCPFHRFSVGILSDRLPICPGGRAITVTRDGYSVVCEMLVND